MRVFLALSVVIFFFLMVEMAPPRSIFEEHYLNSKICPRIGCTTDSDCTSLYILGFYCSGKLNDFIFVVKIL